LLELENGQYACGDHQNVVKPMIASVFFPDGCEECTRKAFAEALESTLEEQRKRRQQV
jgi:hypothetical protein